MCIVWGVAGMTFCLVVAMMFAVPFRLLLCVTCGSCRPRCEAPLQNVPRDVSSVQDKITNIRVQKRVRDLPPTSITCGSGVRVSSSIDIILPRYEQPASQNVEYTGQSRDIAQSEHIAAQHWKATYKSLSDSHGGRGLRRRCRLLLRR